MNDNKDMNEIEIKSYQNARKLIALGTAMKVIFIIFAVAMIPLSLVLLFTSKKSEDSYLSKYDVDDSSYNYSYLGLLGLIPFLILAAYYYDYTLKNKAYILLSNLKKR